MFDLTKIIRKNILNLLPYSSARDEYKGMQGIFLDANENSLGSVSSEAHNRYPDPQQKLLKNKIAVLENILPEQIFLGNGSDEAIDLLIRAFVNPEKESILYCPPTYGMYEVAANINAANIIEIPLNEYFDLDEEKILEACKKPDLKIIFLCSPNNPTGNLLKIDSIEKIVRAFEGIVVIDEAYQDFSNEISWVKRLHEFPNLVVLKTFSKAWGMANLRLGMAFASAEIIAICNKIKPPYNINGETQKIVLEALQNNTKKNRYVQTLIEEREILRNKLKNFSFVEKIYPSDANFLLVKVKNANDLYQFLIKKQIIIRNRNSALNCENCVRITIGSAVENAMLLKNLEKYN
jgi:histidinol-phosphate aminotransferase